MTNVFDKNQWCVHVRGTGNALAAHTFSEAVEQCARINSTVTAMIRRGVFDHEYSPIVWANVELWADICPGVPHEPENTDWDEVC